MLFVCVFVFQIRRQDFFLGVSIRNTGYRKSPNELIARWSVAISNCACQGISFDKFFRRDDWVRDGHHKNDGWSYEKKLAHPSLTKKQTTKVEEKKILAHRRQYFSISSSFSASFYLKWPHPYVFELFLSCSFVVLSADLFRWWSSNCKLRLLQ